MRYDHGDRFFRISKKFLFLFSLLLATCRADWGSGITIPDSAYHPNWNLLDHNVCGLGVSSDRIIGGKNATLGQFPWLARLGYMSTDDGGMGLPSFRCGGSLINRNYVVTAAHCVTNLPSGSYLSTIRLGENVANQNIDCDENICAEPVQDFRPVKVLAHLDYGKPLFKNDIALIRLDRPAIFNGWVAPICLPHGKLLVANYVGSVAEVAGWGVYDMREQLPSEYLLYVKVPVVSLQNCIDHFRKFAVLDVRQLCAGGFGGQDSCGGDSGGPLMRVDALDGPPKYHLLGIVSFGARFCGTAGVPAVYTRIAMYTDWILNNIEP